MEMFELAVKTKLRFSYKGLNSCGVEDLWDLTLQDLDGIYKGLNKLQKESEGESLLETKTVANEELDLKISIIKHIVDFKKAEKKAKEDEKVLREFDKKVLDIIASKEDESLKGKSIEELKALLKR